MATPSKKSSHTLSEVQGSISPARRCISTERLSGKQALATFWRTTPSNNHHDAAFPELLIEERESPRVTEPPGRYTWSINHCAALGTYSFPRSAAIEEICRLAISMTFQNRSFSFLKPCAFPRTLVVFRSCTRCPCLLSGEWIYLIFFCIHEKVWE